MFHERAHNLRRRVPLPGSCIEVLPIGENGLLKKFRVDIDDAGATLIREDGFNGVRRFGERVARSANLIGGPLHLVGEFAAVFRRGVRVRNHGGALPPELPSGNSESGDEQRNTDALEYLLTGRGRSRGRGPGRSFPAFSQCLLLRACYPANGVRRPASRPTRSAAIGMFPIGEVPLGGAELGLQFRRPPPSLDHAGIEWTIRIHTGRVVHLCRLDSTRAAECDFPGLTRPHVRGEPVEFLEFGSEYGAGIPLLLDFLVRDHLDLHGLVLKIASVRIRTRRKPELGELARGLEEIPPHGPCHHRRPSILKLLENLIRQHVDDAIFRGPKSVRLRCQARGTRTNSGVNRGREEPPKRMWLLERACTEWKTQQHL